MVAAGAPPKAMASLIIDGKRREVPVAEGEAILDAALRAGMDLPFACKGGMCSTCRAKLVEGDAQMEVNYSLEPWELKAGFILTCQARPTSDGSWWITITCRSDVIPSERRRSVRADLSFRQDEAIDASLAHRRRR